MSRRSTRSHGRLRDRRDGAQLAACGAALPDAFVARMRRLLGDAEAVRLFAALAAPPVRGLRVQPGRADLDGLAATTGWSLTPAAWNACAATVTPDDAPSGRHPLHEAGAFYLQDPSATAPAAALAVRPGERVVDLAAAPGGKATQLVGDLGGRGVLVANDLDPKRVPALARNLERVGARNAVITQAEPAALARAWPGGFDAVLLDAPCSGEGMFRKSADAVDGWSERTIVACRARQDRLLDAAAALLAPGGRLVYATCTFAPEENEAAVLGLLARRPDLRPVPLDLAGVAPGRPDWTDPRGALSADACARLWPQRVQGDGHFVAMLRRDGGPGSAPAFARTVRETPAMETPAKEIPVVETRPPHRSLADRTHRRVRATGGRRRADAAQPPTPRTMAAWTRFASTALVPGALPEAKRPGALREAGGLLWARPSLDRLDDAPSAGVRILRPGLPLGRRRTGDRFEPSHALAQALRPDEVRSVLDLDPAGPTVARYLVGEEFEVATFAGFDVRPRGPACAADGEDGHLQVTVAGVPLGWLSRRGDRLRNPYPKGLRLRP